MTEEQEKNFWDFIKFVKEVYSQPLKENIIEDFVELVRNAVKEMADTDYGEKILETPEELLETIREYYKKKGNKEDYFDDNQFTYLKKMLLAMFRFHTEMCSLDKSAPV